MVKTKTRSRVKTKSMSEAVAKTSAKTNNQACNPSCYICSLFKLMVGLFILMILFWFWLVYCLGDLNTQMNSSSRLRAMSVSRADYVNNIKLGNKFCTDTPIDQLSSKINSVLTNKEGNEFDKEFLLEMTISHQANLEMAKLALTKSSRADIKKLSQDIIDAQTKELEQMKVWQTEWFSAK
jgi:hypothetical protein